MNNSYETIELRQDGLTLTVALNLPKSHNAMTPTMIRELTAVFQQINTLNGIRVVVLTGNGRSFCAGADLNFMRAAADYGYDENVADGNAIFDLMLAIDSCHKPVIGRINGAAIGGGAGLVSCCDIVVAADRAKFGFSEARLGILPAVISPFVLEKIGVGNGRELFLTGERFNAAHARQIGLVNRVVDEKKLDEAVAERIAQLLFAAPNAQKEGKEMIRAVAHRPKAEMRDYTSNLIASRRASTEGKEGMESFLKKRKPAWNNES